MRPVIPEYRIAGQHFLWRHESPADETGILVGFVFNPDDAVNLAGLLNSAVALASVVPAPQETRASVYVTPEQLGRLKAIGGLDVS